MVALRSDQPTKTTPQSILGAYKGDLQPEQITALQTLLDSAKFKGQCFIMCHKMGKNNKRKRQHELKDCQNVKEAEENICCFHHCDFWLLVRVKWMILHISNRPTGIFNDNKSNAPSKMDVSRENLWHVQSFMLNNAHWRSTQIWPATKSGLFTCCQGRFMRTQSWGLSEHD